MNYAEFKRRVNHNTRILTNALDNDISMLMVAGQVYTWDSEPNELYDTVLMRNVWDIIPSLFLGVLAKLDATGIDAHEVQDDDTVIDIEIKTSTVNGNKVWRGPQGGLYTGIGQGVNQKAALTSTLNASYTCHSTENLLSKNMRTVLMVADTSGFHAKNTFLDAWELNGNSVVEYLGRTEAKNRTIKLGSFMKNGQQTKTVVPLAGFEQFREKLERTSPYRDTWLIENGYL